MESVYTVDYCIITILLSKFINQTFVKPL